MKKLKAVLAGCLLGLLLLGMVNPVLAIEVPPTGTPIFVQTNGPTTPLIKGDWYTNNANGAVAGYHYFVIYIPCGWPASQAVNFDLFSPEMNSNSPGQDELLPTGDPAQNSIFELYGPGTTLGPGANVPGPGAAGSLRTATYAPSTQPEQWVRFYTLPAPVACGRYILRAETGTDNQNGWRLRAGIDNDADPNNAPPANADNPDGQPGTNDEIVLGLTQTSYQHNITGTTQCLTLYQFVTPNQASVAFHNFDLDNNVRVRYYAPSQTLDPTGLTGGTPGTLSGEAVWNGGTSTDRGTGDVIANPESGWWRIVTCVVDLNQFIQEGQMGVPAFFSEPPTPRMTLTKDDGVTTITQAGQTLTYTLNFQNVSNVDPYPGAAINTIIRDTLPPNTTYQSCAINPPYTGTCSLSGNEVVFTLNQVINAGAGGSLSVSTRLNAGAPAGSYTNTAQLSYSDILGNPFQPVTAQDIDQLPADLTITKTDNQATATPGRPVTYTIVATNNGPGAVNGATIADNVPASLTQVSWTCQASSGSACGSPAGSGNNISLTANLAVGGTATLTVTGTLDQAATGTLSNTATVSPPNGVTDSDPSNNSATDIDTITTAETPVIGLAKTVTGVTNNGDGSYTVNYSLVVRNYGNVTLSQVQVNENLATTFGGAQSFSLAGPVTTGAGLTANSGYTGSPPSIALLAGSDSLAPGASGTISLNVRIVPGGNLGPYTNQATATGTSPAGTVVTDNSQNGVNPDPDNDGNPTNNNTPTVVTFAPPSSPGAGAPTPTPTPPPPADNPAPSATPTATPAPSATPAPQPSPSPAPQPSPSPTPAGSPVDPTFQKKADTTLAIPGQTVIFTLTVTNPGSLPATNLVVTDQVPPTFVVQGATASQGQASVNGQTVTANLGTLPPGGVATVLVTTVVAPGASGTFDNLGRLTGQVGDRPVGSGTSNVLTALVTITVPGLPNTGRDALPDKGGTNPLGWLAGFVLLASGLWLAGRGFGFRLGRFNRPAVETGKKQEGANHEE